MAKETKLEKIIRQKRERREWIRSLGEALESVGVEVQRKDLSKAFPNRNQKKAQQVRDLKRKQREVKQ